MTLNSALQIGQSAILASQAAIQVAGNNMANAASPGFHRQRASLAPATSTRIGNNGFIGTGVVLQDISRVVDTALQSRVRGAIARDAGADIDQRFLAAIESLQNELSGNDLSSKLEKFINAFSELSNNPNDEAVRSLVLRESSSLAEYVAGLRSQYNDVRIEIDRATDAAITKADGLLTEIAALNLEINQVEQGVGTANGLRDRRDTLIDELSTLLDVSTIQHENGTIDVLVNSIPLVMQDGSRGVELRTTNQNGGTVIEVRVSADGSILNVTDGQVGALLRQRNETLDPAIEALDTFAHELIFNANKVHSQSQGQSGWSSVTGLTQVDDVTTPLDSTTTNLPFTITNGSFRIHVTNVTNGLRQSAQVLVDPSTMTLTDVMNAINAAGLPNVTASLTADNRLKIDSTAGYEITFSEDSGGALAALGVNALFDGDDAESITLNQALLDDPRLLASGRDHINGSNGGALGMVALQDASIDALGGRSLPAYWLSTVNDHAVKTSAAKEAADSAAIVKESLIAQEQAVGGVSLDEESIDLITFQRQFQAAARFISVIDDTIQTLLNMVS